MADAGEDGSDDDDSHQDGGRYDSRVEALKDQLEAEQELRQELQAEVERFVAKSERLQTLLDEANEKIARGIEAHGRDWDDEPERREVSHALSGEEVC